MTSPSERPGEGAAPDPLETSGVIGVLGAGRLGSALAAALVAAGAGRVEVASRRADQARALARTLQVEAVSPGALVERCGLAFLAVPDGAIAEVARGLPWHEGQSVVHCSGALGLDALDAAKARGASVGCLHPLQTFPASPPAGAAALFHGITCGVEGSDAALGLRLEALARRLGARTVRLEGVDRALYHAAAVFVSNDLVALAAAAARAWSRAGLPADAAREALGPLLLTAATNVGRLPLPVALTGPIARGDVATVERHLRALEAEPDLRDLYRRLAAELLRLDLNLPAAPLARLRDILG